MVGSMKEINGSSERISKIIQVIEDIAFQSNILALDAAIEAAPASNAASLAQRCAQAAKDTALLIEESIARSNADRTRLDQVGRIDEGRDEHSRGSTSDAEQSAAERDELAAQARGLYRIGEKLRELIADGEQNGATLAAGIHSSAGLSRSVPVIRSDQTLRPAHAMQALFPLNENESETR